MPLLRTSRIRLMVMPMRAASWRMVILLIRMRLMICLPFIVHPFQLEAPFISTGVSYTNP